MKQTNENIADHRYLLLERFLAARRKNPFWSLRAYAIKLGVSASALSEILSGKRTLTKKIASRFAEKLKLDPSETQRLIHSALVAKVKAQLPENEDFNPISDGNFTQLNLEAFKAIADWYHLAILSLFDTQGNQSNPEWVASRLGISKAEAEGALKRLLLLGLLKGEGKKLRSVGKPLSIETQGYEPAIRNFLHQTLDKAHQSLDHDPAEQREICSVTIAIDPDNLEKARKAIKRFRRDLSLLLQGGVKKRVYSFSMQLFPLEQGNSSIKRGEKS